MTVAIYLLSGTFLITVTVLRYIMVSEGHLGLKRFLLAFKIHDPRDKSQDVIMMLIQYTSIIMLVIMPGIDKIESIFKTNNTLYELFLFVKAFIFPILLIGAIKFFDITYWSRKRR